MSKNMAGIRYFIQPSDVWEYYQNNKEHLVEKMDMIANNDTDDFTKQVCAYLDNMGNVPCIVTEDAECIICSEYLSEENYSTQITNMCMKYLC